MQLGLERVHHVLVAVSCCVELLQVGVQVHARAFAVTKVRCESRSRRCRSAWLRVGLGASCWRLSRRAASQGQQPDGTSSQACVCLEGRLKILYLEQGTRDNACSETRDSAVLGNPKEGGYGHSLGLTWASPEAHTHPTGQV